LTAGRERGYDSAMATPADARYRAHARLGAFAFVLAIVDLAVFRVAAHGRDAYFALVGRPGWGSLAAALFVAFVVFGHATLAVVRHLDDPDDSPYGDRDRRRLQWVTALFIAPFVGVRVAYGPLAAFVRGLDAFGLHQAMRDDFPQLVFLLVQCLGATAVGLHVFQGLAARARRIGRTRRIPFAFFIAAAYVLVYLDTLAAFVIGRAFIPGI
jgi:hypothetical protein